MGVTAMGGEVWGGNGRFHRALISYGQRAIGETGYLSRFERSFRSGHDLINLDGERPSDVRSYRDCLAALASREPNEIKMLLGLQYDAVRLRDMLLDLVEMIDRHLNDAP